MQNTIKAIANKNAATYEPWQKALMTAMGQKCDWTNKNNLNDFIEYINN